MEKLDNTKLRVELARFDKSRSWLARALGLSKQYFHLKLKKGRADEYIDRIATILGIPREDLIK